MKIDLTEMTDEEISDMTAEAIAELKYREEDSPDSSKFETLQTIEYLFNKYKSLLKN